MSENTKLESLQKCRNIKEEIIKYGVSDTEIKHLIKLLALELEDTNLMRNILKQYNDNKESINV